MVIKFDANQLINGIMNELDNIEYNKKLIPKGYYITPETLYWENYKDVERAEGKLSSISEAFGIHGDVLYYIGRIARRWYKRNNWQYTLNDNAADGLLTYALNNYQTGHWNTCKPERICEHQKYCHLY